MIEKVCAICGATFAVYPSQAERRKTCGKECKAAWRSKAQSGENSPLWKPRVKKVCPICGDPFETFPSQAEARKTCSPECRSAWQSKSLRGENNPTWHGGKAKKACLICGDPLEVWPSQAERRKTCARRECMAAWQSKTQSGENNAGWLGGKSFEPYGLEFNDALKEAIRDRAGRRCVLCGKSEADNGRALDCHHVNYDKGENGQSNLVALCNSCHSKTNGDREMHQAALETLMVMRGADDVSVPLTDDFRA